MHNNQWRIKGDQLPMINPIDFHVISDSFATLIHVQLNSAAPQKLFPRFEQQSMQIWAYNRCKHQVELPQLAFHLVQPMPCLTFPVVPHAEVKNKISLSYMRMKPVITKNLESAQVFEIQVV